jgi:hypothetical protein
MILLENLLVNVVVADGVVGGGAPCVIIPSTQATSTSRVLTKVIELNKLSFSLI